MPNAGNTFTISGNAYTVSQAGLLTGTLSFSQTVPDAGPAAVRESSIIAALLHVGSQPVCLYINHT